jgi:hypothetical protein
MLCIFKSRKRQRLFLFDTSQRFGNTPLITAEDVNTNKTSPVICEDIQKKYAFIYF